MIAQATGKITVRVAVVSGLLMGALLGDPAMAVAQDARLDQLRQSFPADVVTRIEELAATARERGVPADPILDKALEGAAKRVPAERVVLALSSYLERLERARSVLGAERTAGDLVAGADALRRGVPEETIRQLGETRPGDVAVPVVVLGDLVSLGVPAEQAFETVQLAMDGGSQSHQLLAIPAVVERLVRQGRSPAVAAREIAMTFAQGFLPIGIPGPVPSGLQVPIGVPVPPGAGPPAGIGKENGTDVPPIDPPPSRGN